ncbi:MAG TPA: hypothetical protein VFB45_21460 [Pseudolabrys sp.]|nr:hypothetical protein [Pseudolabrys sp.]
MILKSLVGLSLLVSASLDIGPPAERNDAAMQLSVRQKEAAMLPLVRGATDCIVRNVSADSRFADNLQGAELNDLIVDAMSACAAPVRAMIDQHDRMFGQGSGEAFFMGPYLDVLPAAVIKQVKATPPKR